MDAGVGADDAADVAVEDSEVVPILETEHPITDAVPAFVDDGDERTEFAARFEEGVRPLVEVCDVAAVYGAHDGVAAGGVQLEPVERHLVAQHVAVVGDRDPTVPVEPTDGEFGESLAECVGDEALLGISLPSVLDQFDDRDAIGERGEQSAGFDRRELLRVADEDHLAADWRSLARRDRPSGWCRAFPPRR